MRLGAIILIPFIAALAVRGPLERAFVLKAPGIGRPARQFFFDFLLALAAGALAGGYNMAILRFPLGSSAKLMVGVLAASFFIGLDMALTRERKVIREALEKNLAPPPLKKIKPMTRTFAWVATITAFFVVVVMTLVLAKDMTWLSETGRSPDALLSAALSVAYEIAFVMLVLLLMLINVIVGYTRTLNLVFRVETEVLGRVSRGDFSRKVPVAGANEFGVIAEFINDMIDGLKHRIELLDALEVAEEVQSGLLPKGPPEVPGLDIAADSRYMDETGGDYYDFLDLPDGSLGVVVGDVAGHGVGSALLMASARSLLRLSASQSADLEKVAELVNTHLARDVDETGGFLTLFLLRIDVSSKELAWVNCGHDPAFIFDPETDDFISLDGGGLALGLLDDATFHIRRRQGWPRGGVLVIGTDGIWETHDPSREMFGRERFKASVRANAGRPAKDIPRAVLEELSAFRGPAPQEDDVTLVVVKFQD